jgi:mannose-6-phosphate isomerase-like protein (cupin superfamily)
MDEFVRRLPNKSSYSQKGLSGYRFPLKNLNVEIYFVDVKQGHDTFLISKKCAHIYYILYGRGFFVIRNKKHAVKAGMLIELPPKIEYTYSGRMKLLLIMNPPWFKGNDKLTKMNPSVK